MPGFDGTGPRGLGPMTGGGRGLCNPYSRGMGSPYMGYHYGAPFAGYPYGNYPYSSYHAYPYGGFGMGRGMGGRGFGMGRGMGRGFGMGRWMGVMPFPLGAGMSPFGPPMDPEQETEFLRNQAQMLKEELDQIDTRISELEKAS